MKIFDTIGQILSPLRMSREEERMSEAPALNQVDLCFVVDTTGSMGSFIAAAQKQLLDTIDLLSTDNGIDLHTGLVEYRDHPPQERSFVTRVHSLTANRKEMQKVINSLKADGGGDAPEAVYDGLQAACTEIKWRSHSCRFILLIGDSPPHGYKPSVSENASKRNQHTNYGDTWPDGCPCGLTAQAVAAAAENERITLHALCMGNSPATADAFEQIAIGTGGYSGSARDANQMLARIIEVLTGEFRNLQFDAQVLETVQKLEQIDVKEIAGTLNCPRLQAAASIARLGKRGFLT
jgi:hypothetical protein